MAEPILVIMAAGMGSRFGGLKQISPVDGQGHTIMDFSLFDARRAGFRRVIFVISRALEADFRAAVGERAERSFEVQYVFQELDELPEGFSVPAGREKPWGTGHAVACCRRAVDAPFAVINADDFYGADAFRAVYAFLSGPRAEGEQAMVGYRLASTLSDSGYVSRGLCRTEGGYLLGISEHTHIEKTAGGGIESLYEGQRLSLDGGETVSMNFWGFGREAAGLLWDGFAGFLREALASNPLKCEYYLPSLAGSLLESGAGRVRVLETSAQWHGVTYREDLPALREAIAALKERGEYPAEF